MRSEILLLGMVVAACRPATSPDPVPSPHGLYPDTHALSPPTRRALDSLNRWVGTVPSPEAARAAGYHQLAASDIQGAGMDVNPLVGEHWLNERVLRQTDRVDTARPAYLMFYPFGTARVPTLVGVAYAMLQPTGAEMPPGFDGDRDRWHAHIPCASVPGIRNTLASSVAECRALGGVPGRGQIAMLHVWVNVPNPGGVFAADNPALPYLALGLRPPDPAMVQNPDGTRRTRQLALALAETLGAHPRLTSKLVSRADSTFTETVAPHRAMIASMIPSLRAADRQNDSERYARAADRAVGAWMRIQAAYLNSAPTPALRKALEHWFAITTQGRAHSPIH